MYSIEDELIKSPVISSMLRAENEFRGWLTANDYGSIKDASGLPWTLTIDCVQIPDETGPTRSKWQIKLQLTTSLDAKALQDTRVLDRDKDERLLTLFGDEKIDINIQPLYFLAKNLEDSRRLVAQKVQSLRVHFESQDFYAIKKSLVERRVDDGNLFCQRA
ncbi:MAG: hypothetical protein AB7T49_08545 [Oligoflexales bacterium]